MLRAHDQRVIERRAGCGQRFRCCIFLGFEELLGHVARDLETFSKAVVALLDRED